MYITNVIKTKSTRIEENKSHPENIRKNRKHLKPTEILKGNGHGKEYVTTWFETQREGKLHIDVCPTEDTGKIEIYIDYFPGEEGSYTRQIDIDIETGDVFKNEIKFSEDFIVNFRLQVTNPRVKQTYN